MHATLNFSALLLFSVSLSPAVMHGQLSLQLAKSGNSANANALPPYPKGRSTVMGGEITSLDPVRDQFTLKIFGGHPIKILFDERTQVFQDGKRISLLDLRPVRHASVETTLDGTKVFALRVHTLSQLPEGESQGKVVAYDAQKGELTLDSQLSREPLELRVPSGVPIVAVGQIAHAAQSTGLAGLMPGSLVDVKFTSGTGGRGVATRIDVLATPGSSFVFRGNLSFLDAHAGQLALVDAEDDQTYRISFDPSLFPVAKELRQGSHVKVTATFDGSKYTASAISME
jgi:hypothetical protein